MSKSKSRIHEKLDLNHYYQIITSENNWKLIFSETFSEKESLRDNLESLIVFKTKLERKAVSLEELYDYPYYIYSITNCFTKSFNIFLSYATKDSKYFAISEIAKRLETFPEIDKVFYWETESGEDIVDYMNRTLQISQIFILFCTRNSEKSKAVKSEWESAYQLRQKNQMKIIPICEKQKFVPALLMPILNVEFIKDNFDTFIDNLHSEILRKR